MKRKKKHEHKRQHEDRIWFCSDYYYSLTVGAPNNSTITTTPRTLITSSRDFFLGRTAERRRKGEFTLSAIRGPGEDMDSMRCSWRFWGGG
ncbi:unnamed protein product [Calypogeia fissa]